MGLQVIGHNQIIFDPCGTLKVNGGRLGNATICGISEKCFFMLLLNSVQSLTVLTFCAQWMGLAALLLKLLHLLICHDKSKYRFTFF